MPTISKAISQPKSGHAKPSSLAVIYLMSWEIEWQGSNCQLARFCGSTLRTGEQYPNVIMMMRLGNRGKRGQMACRTADSPYPDSTSCRFPSLSHDDSGVVSGHLTGTVPQPQYDTFCRSMSSITKPRNTRDSIGVSSHSGGLHRSEAGEGAKVVSGSTRQ